MRFVLDASAMIAYLRDEPGAARVSEVLSNPETYCTAHALNLCEVYYDFYRSGGASVAQGALEDLSRLAVFTADDMTPEFWKHAGKLKAVHRRVSLADCFAITLAEHLAATILTSDHHEFDALVEAGVCKVSFIR